LQKSDVLSVDERARGDGILITISIDVSNITHTHTHARPFSGTTGVSLYQKGKTNLNYTDVRDSE